MMQIIIGYKYGGMLVSPHLSSIFCFLFSYITFIRMLVFLKASNIDVYILCSCMQRAKYDIGEEAVHRFSLPPEDRATLELAEWVDTAFRRASVCPLRLNAPVNFML